MGEKIKNEKLITCNGKQKAIRKCLVRDVLKALFRHCEFLFSENKQKKMTKTTNQIPSCTGVARNAQSNRALASVGGCLKSRILSSLRGGPTKQSSYYQRFPDCFTSLAMTNRTFRDSPRQTKGHDWRRRDKSRLYGKTKNCPAKNKTNAECR
jgi:hypothetical protein